MYDVDNIGANIFVNGQSIGHLATGHGWHEQHFNIPKELLKKGSNKLSVRSKKWSDTEVEDFLMRHGRIIVRDQ